MPADATADAVADLEAEIAAMFAPLEPPQILAEIEALRNHFGEWADRSPGQAKRLHRDWIDDLSDAPGAFVIEACRRWRRQDDPPNKRPPHTSGELMALVRSDLGRMRFLADQVLRANAALKLPG